MSTLTRFARTFARAEDGATTAEYGIIIVVVAGIAIFVLSQLNGALHPRCLSQEAKALPGRRASCWTTETSRVHCMTRRLTKPRNWR